MFESYRYANDAFKEQRYRNQGAEVELILRDNDVEYASWLLVDSFSSRCEGGLGSVASDVTGVGMLQSK